MKRFGTIARIASKRNIIIAAGLTTCLACAGTTGAFAYLTGSATSQTPFIVATSLSISADGLSAPESNKALVPLERVSERPVLSNTSNIPAYAAMRLSMPLYSGTVAQADGSRKQENNVNLFTYSLGTGWKLVDDGASSIADNKRVYTYVYEPILNGGTETAPLFDSLTLINMTENDGADRVQVGIDGFAIQAHGFSDATSAWNAYVAQNAGAL